MVKLNRKWQRCIPRSLGLVVLCLFQTSCLVYQKPDMGGDFTVKSPMFEDTSSPNVVFDAGHNNFHSIQTTYAPFATLLKNDGITLKSIESRISRELLNEMDLLIIANAMSTSQKGENAASAFLEQEIKVLKDWIEEGGAMLLIADHNPFGSAAADLATAFGVGMTNCWTVDTLRVNSDIGKKTWLEYNWNNNGLMTHRILQNQDSERQVESVILFTGQSLSYDSTWSPVLQLSPSAQNYYNRSDALVASPDSTTFIPAPEQSQLIAREYGAGRIVVAGEAALFTAQKARLFFKTTRVGFNYRGYDNKQLVLNIIHWLLKTS